MLGRFRITLRVLALLVVSLLLGSWPMQAWAATLWVQETNRNPGLVPTLVAASASGDDCFNDGRTFLRVKNGHASNTYTVTVTAQRIVDGSPVTSPAFSITATGGAAPERFIGPFPVATFSSSSNRVAWTYAGTAIATDLTVACVRVP